MHNNTSWFLPVVAKMALKLLLHTVPKAIMTSRRKTQVSLLAAGFSIQCKAVSWGIHIKEKVVGYS